MFTREELFIFFSSRFTEQQIKNALAKLAEFDSEINPDADEFHGSIVERMEAIFKVIDEAIASTKQLTGTSDLAQIEETAINLANQRAINIPVDTIKGLIDILDAQATVEAVTLFQRRKAIREAVLTQLETNALAEANHQAAKRIDALNQLCNDPEVLDQILQDYGLLTNVESEKQYLELTASCSLDFDVDSFLAQVSNEKKLHPKTVGDTQRLARSLVTSCLKP